jgi:two-component system response regulator PilR (NtrC family)
MRGVRKAIARIARSGIRRVLVTGESGVGKETVAQQLHVQSGRTGPYLSFNCATVARELVESRLFGHVKGAFTGAISDKPGLFRSASGGTLFLDEIAELPYDVQGVLLRVLQENVVQPMGASEEAKVDVLVVAATNRDLRQRVREGLFREDLYWRLSVVQIRMPPLRERESDIAATARQIWSTLAPGRKPLSKEDLAAILAYDWPGNVRELSNVLERAALFDDCTIPQLVDEERAEIARLSLEDPAAGPDPAAPIPGSAPAGPENLDAAIRAHVRRVFDAHGQNIAETARALGIARGTARNYLRPPAP